MIKNKWKRFWTLERHANQGFTLMELIVVMAILGILGGVSVPVYNGYVKKAQRAADEALIAEINQAAASATLESLAMDIKALGTGVLSSNAVKNKSGISVYQTYDSVNDPVPASFARYFVGNEGAALQWYGSLKFIGGKFVGVNSMLNGDLITPEGSDVVDAFNNSSYNSETLGVTGVTKMVNGLAGALASFSNAELLYETEKFQAVLTDLGIDSSNRDPQTLANAAVFYVAKCTSELDEATLWSKVQDNSLQQYLREEQGYSSKDAVFVDTALRYAAATAFVHSEYGSPEQQATMSNTPADKAAALTNIESVTNGTNEYNGNWTIYCLEQEGQNDFHAFYEVMNTLNANQDTFSSYEGDSLFDNAELQAAINKLLGKTT